MLVFSEDLYSTPVPGRSAAQLKHPGMSLVLWLDVWSKGHCETCVASLDHCSCETE